ncbi:MAG TPA: hypothetical protein PLR81_01200 [Treponemataceae bacterium]|jgi:hypothetical protein|nr:hypothetical protein [Treponemataceae bacterium]HPY53010.1 hypothetical protein [Treponemataceae bacterium]
MSFYYLMSQLPYFSLSQSSPLPITESYFLELAERNLNEAQLKTLKNISLVPEKKPREIDSSFLTAYYAWERDLRFVLGQIRGQRLKKDFSVPNNLSQSFEILSIARTATGFESPLEAEQFLNEQRFLAIKKLQPMDYFSLDSVYAYALQLKLALRIKQFNEEAGLAEYRSMYDTILGESK